MRSDLLLAAVVTLSQYVFICESVPLHSEDYEEKSIRRLRGLTDMQYSDQGVLQKFVVMSCPDDFQLVIEPDEAEIVVRWEDDTTEETVKMSTAHHEHSNRIEATIERVYEDSSSEVSGCKFLVTLREQDSSSSELINMHEIDVINETAAESVDYVTTEDPSATHTDSITQTTNSDDVTSPPSTQMSRLEESDVTAIVPEMSIVDYTTSSRVDIEITNKEANFEYVTTTVSATMEDTERTSVSPNAHTQQEWGIGTTDNKLTSFSSTLPSQKAQKIDSTEAVTHQSEIVGTVSPLGLSSTVLTNQGELYTGFANKIPTSDVSLENVNTPSTNGTDLLTMTTVSENFIENATVSYTSDMDNKTVTEQTPTEGNFVNDYTSMSILFNNTPAMDTITTAEYEVQTDATGDYSDETTLLMNSTETGIPDEYQESLSYDEPTSSTPTVTSPKQFGNTNGRMGRIDSSTESDHVNFESSTDEYLYTNSNSSTEINFNQFLSLTNEPELEIFKNVTTDATTLGQELTSVTVATEEYFINETTEVPLTSNLGPVHYETETAFSTIETSTVRPTNEPESSNTLQRTTDMTSQSVNPTRDYEGNQSFSDLYQNGTVPEVDHGRDGCVLVNGTIIQVGGSFTTANCAYSCTCRRQGTLMCNRKGCDQFQECNINDGISDCYCRKGFYHDGEKCIKDCPDRFITFEDGCYHFHNEKMNFDDAQKFCQSMSANLAVIKNGREDAFISSLAGIKKEVWIGAYRGKTEDPVYLTTTGDLQHSQIWSPEMPSGIYRLEFSFYPLHKAHIFLGPKPKLVKEMYEIVLGESGEFNVLIRRCPNCMEKFAKYRFKLTETNVTDGDRFYITFKNNMIELGQVGAYSPFVSWVDRTGRPRDIRYIGFASDGIVTQWRIFFDFHWVDGSPWIYENWYLTEPDLFDDVDACVFANYKYSGAWNDDNCKHQRRFICKM
ncbi:uncharacterized protein [Apostichopus japonicus]|uniref:uncharacterized protein isoform X2 n=1 Tax=Stichopus japonicus TaxID=307972 RepID=UPI003AB84915